MSVLWVAPVRGEHECSALVLLAVRENVPKSPSRHRVDTGRRGDRVHLLLDRPGQVGTTDAASCALRDDGQIFCWGRDHRGLMGRDGSNLGDQPGEMGDNLPVVPLGAGSCARWWICG